MEGKIGVQFGHFKDEMSINDPWGDVEYSRQNNRCPHPDLQNMSP